MKIVPIKVELIDKMGDDVSVVNAARVSFAKESEWQYSPEGKVLNNADKKLIKYLAEHNHWSPFSHAYASFRIKAPIFVARQLVKHTVGLSWNEVSRRYVSTEPEFYLPKTWRKAAENVKQGSSDEVVKEVVKNGKCLYCGEQLVGKKTKYCCDNHQAMHWRERNPYLTKFVRWKASAKSQNIVFDITEEDLDWPKVCPYLDIELNYSSDDRGDSVASLDKIVPELGYVKGNVQIISHLANKMKSSATKEQILTFARNSSLIHGGIFTNTAASYEDFLHECTDTYNKLIANGLCAEQARMFMPQSMMVEWIWSGSLYAFARVCNLRLDSHTQLETQTVAKLIDAYMIELFPESWNVLVK